MIQIDEVINCKHRHWTPPDHDKRKCKDCGVKFTIAEFLIFKKLRDVQDSLSNLELKLKDD